jgi:hypothetical protein
MVFSMFVCTCLFVPFWLSMPYNAALRIKAGVKIFGRQENNLTQRREAAKAAK